MIRSSGFNHIDLATKDMDATRTFYEDVLGFPLVRADLVEIVDRGRVKHYFFDIGSGQLLGFMSGEDVEGFNKDFDSGINAGLGLPPGVYHSLSTPPQRTSWKPSRSASRLMTSPCAGPRITRAGRSRSTSRIPTAFSSSTAT